MKKIKENRKQPTAKTGENGNTSDVKPDTNDVAYVWKTVKTNDATEANFNHVEEIHTDQEDEQPEPKMCGATKRPHSDGTEDQTQSEPVYTDEQPKKKTKTKKTAKVIYLDENFKRLESTKSPITADSLRVTFYPDGNAVVLHCVTVGNKKILHKSISIIHSQLETLYKNYEKQQLSEEKAPILPLIKSLLGQDGESIYAKYIQHHDKHNRSGSRDNTNKQKTEAKTAKTLLKEMELAKTAGKINELERLVYLRGELMKKIDHMTEDECQVELEKIYKLNDNTIKGMSMSDFTK